MNRTPMGATSRRSLAAAATLAAALVALSAPARADLASQFAMSSRSLGLGGAYAAVSEDMAALYYNPAGLVQLRSMTVSAGLLAGLPFLREDGADPGTPREVSTYLHAGLPLGGSLEDLLAFGVSLNLPWGKLLGSTLHKKQEPYFVLYDNSVQQLQIRLGAAGRIPWKPLSFLTFGVSVQVLGAVRGEIGFYSPFQPGGDAPADPDAALEAWADIEVPTSTFVTVGMMAAIGDSWRVGLTYHQAQSIDVQFPISFTTRLSVSSDLEVGIPVQADARFTTKYHPQQLTLGASYRRGALMVALDLSWIDYSAYQIPYARLELDLERLKLDPGLRLFLGPDATLLDPMRPDVRWRDVLVTRVGAEYRVLPWLVVRGGYSFEPSPLTGTDFPIYDCDKHGFALGARVSLHRPLGLLPGWFHWDLAVQELLYAGRAVMGAEVGGHVFAVSTGLEISFE